MTEWLDFNWMTTGTGILIIIILTYFIIGLKWVIGILLVCVLVILITGCSHDVCYISGNKSGTISGYICPQGEQK